MCGICGIYNFKSMRPVKADKLVQMRDSMVHRGPDEAGLYAHEDLGLAVRRLSIIDLQSGSQPIWNEDHSVVAIFNGEIYNYRTLSKELAARGHHFKTRSDTETIVHAYEEHGDRCLDHLKGMFAFALWDNRLRRMLIARDRLGIKPLFYAETKGGLIFGSEIKAILAAGFPRSLNKCALDQYFSHFYVPTPLTIFEGIRRLPPGFALVCEEGELKEFEYWDLEYDPQPLQKEEDYYDGVREHLMNAVKRHLQSDVPLGAFLSGGLDSSTVVALMAQLIDQPVNTFTIGFTYPSYDERGLARQAAAHLQTRHCERVVNPDWGDLVRRLVKCFDEPFGDYSAIATYAVSQLAREHVKVVLSGDGGDELFAGYQTHYAHRVARLYQRVPSPIRKRLIKPLIEKLPTSMDRITVEYMAKRFVAGAELSFERAHYSWKVIFNEKEKELLYDPEGLSTLQNQDGFSLFERLFRKVSHLDPLHQILYVDAKTFLTDDNLTKVDRVSMSHGIEVRVPLLDDELVEFVRRIPPNVKQPRWGTKHLLRRAMKNILPDAIVKGAKKGFTPPMSYWLQNELRETMLDTLSPRKLSDTGLFHGNYVEQLMNDHLRGRADHNRKLWALMMFMLWHEEYQLS